MIPDLGPLSVLCVVDVTMSQCSNGDGTTPIVEITFNYCSCKRLMPNVNIKFVS